MDVKGKRVLVTGAGCLGVAVVDRLVAGGASLSVVDVSEKALASFGDDVATALADITDPVAIKELVAGQDVVVHTAAVLDGDGDQMERVNVAGAETITHASAAAGVGRLVHVSSNAVYGIDHTTDITEDMGPSDVRQTYGKSKAEGEKAVRRIATESGLEWTVIRPAGIFGPGARYFTMSYFKRGKRRPVVFVGKGQGAMYCSYVDDVADLIAVAAVHPQAAGEVFNCVIDPPPTQREYMAAWSRLSGHESYLGVPMGLAKGAALLLRPFSPRGSNLRELGNILDYTDRYVRIDSSKAKRLLGWEPRYDLESGVKATVPWLVSRGLLEG